MTTHPHSSDRAGLADGLLPCPFCGGEAEFVRKGSARQSCIVACTDCGCRLETGEVWSSGERWNTRPTPANPDTAKLADKIERFMEVVRSRWNFEENEFDAIEKVIFDPECVAALRQSPSPATTVITCASGCKGPCDFSGWIDLTEPTTGRITGGTACCKTCGMFAIDHSLRYGA